MTYCNEENLKDLKKAYIKKKLFGKKLKIETFYLIIEIILNICSKNGELRKCFSRNVLKKLKRNKKIIRYLVDEEKDIEKRKKKFMKLSPSQRKNFRHALKEFFTTCIDKCD